MLKIKNNIKITSLFLALSLSLGVYSNVQAVDMIDMDMSTFTPTQLADAIRNTNTISVDIKDRSASGYVGQIDDAIEFYMNPAREINEKQTSKLLKKVAKSYSDGFIHSLGDLKINPGIGFNPIIESPAFEKMLQKTIPGDSPKERNKKTILRLAMRQLLESTNYYNNFKNNARPEDIIKGIRKFQSEILEFCNKLEAE